MKKRYPLRLVSTLVMPQRPLHSWHHMTFQSAPSNFRLLILILTLCAASAVLAQAPVPPLQQRVTDLTSTFNAAQRQSLEDTLRQIETRHGAQIAVLLINSTAPEAIEQYSLRVAETWKLGRKGVDDGILLVVAKQDRALRFEVGYGLEGAIPDAIAKRIVSDTIVPYLKNDDFYGGINAGIAQVSRLIEGEPLPPPETPNNSAPNNGFAAIIIAAFAGAGILRALFGRLIGATLNAGLVGFLSWLVLGSLGMALVIGVIALLFTLLSGSGIGPMGPGQYRGGGGFGGGFGGRGGGFGGGGASGRW